MSGLVNKKDTVALQQPLKPFCGMCSYAETYWPNAVKIRKERESAEMLTIFCAFIGLCGSALIFLGYGLVYSPMWIYVITGGVLGTLGAIISAGISGFWAITMAKQLPELRKAVANRRKRGNAYLSEDGVYHFHVVDKAAQLRAYPIAALDIEDTERESGRLEIRGVRAEKSGKVRYLGGCLHCSFNMEGYTEPLTIDSGAETTLRALNQLGPSALDPGTKDQQHITIVFPNGYEELRAVRRVGGFPSRNFLIGW